VTLIDKTDNSPVSDTFLVTLKPTRGKASSVDTKKYPWIKGTYPTIVRNLNLPDGVNRFTLSVADKPLLYSDLFIDGEYNITITIDDNYFDISQTPLDVSEACEDHSSFKVILPS